MNLNESEDKEYFLSLFLKNHRRIYGFIASLVPNANDAEDLMQETLMVMWRRMSEFKPDTNFAAWGIAIAYRKIMKYRASRPNKALMFSEEAMQEIILRDEKLSHKSNDYMAALQRCLEKLKAEDRQVVRLRYENEIPVKRMTDILGGTLDNTYKKLARIHHLLQGCIRKTVVAWETHPQ
jgi:RNA polymerase sigma-70 factor (ECF subfamily)